MAVRMTFMCSVNLFVQHLLQVLTIAVLQQRLRQPLQLRRVDPATPVRDLLRTRHLQSLALLQRRDELPRFHQAVVCAGVEPGVAAAHDLHVELSLLQVRRVHVRDLQLPARARRDAGRDVADLLVIEVQARDGVAALGHLGLFLDAERAAVVIEVHHAVALRIVHVVGEDAGTFGAGRRTVEQVLQVVAVEDIVAQHQRARGAADKLAAEDERLRQAVRARLHAVTQVQAPAAAVTEQRLETRRVLRRADDEDVADAGEHQRAQRVVDHRLVIHRQQLLADGQCRRVQPGAGAAGKDDAFALHGVPLCLVW